MILYVDSESRIRAVDRTTDKTLTPLYVDESNPLFPFTGWSTAKICCYKVTVTKGVVTMMTPYVDSRIIDQVDLMGHSIEAISPYEVIEKASMGDTEVVFTGVPDGVVTIDARDLEGNFLEYRASKSEDIITVIFDSPLEYAADIRLVVN